MKRGDTINGYRILEDFTTAGGGLSKWTFSEKDGKQYFIKEFLSPTYPTDDSPGSLKVKAEKEKRCRKFEQHHRSLLKTVSSVCREGGNLVFTVDFFRNHTKYYKVTDKVDVSGLKIEHIAKLSLNKRLIILKTVAHSLNILHQLNIVHGDLKPDNILIKQTKDNYFTSKLIDFDNSYFSGSPPENSDEIVGDMVYYSPELARFIQNDKSIKPENLQVKSDIFALGLVYCQYLTGNLPSFDQVKYHYPCVAVNGGCILRIDGAGLPDKLVSGVNAMIDADPIKRPTIKQVFEILKGLDKIPDEPAAEKRGLTGSLVLKHTPTSEKPIAESRLRGSLIKKLKEKY